MRKGIIFLASISVFILCLSLGAFAQNTTGDLEGTVKDPKGAVVPGVSVTITGLSVGYSRTVQTNAEGFYKVFNIPEGTYKITTVALKGFSAATAQAIVSIEKTTTADITLGI